MTNLKPILFSTEMVQAILEGRKTMTRRVIKPQPKDGYTPRILKGNDQLLHLESRKSATELEYIEWNVTQKNTVLWVRETFMHSPNYPLLPEKYRYKASVSEQYLVEWKGCWTPSIFMPKEAARIFLKVKNIRLERLQDISEEDAIAEGILPDPGNIPFKPDTKFFQLWETMYGEDSVIENPYVWVIEFERIAKPEIY